MNRFSNILYVLSSDLCDIKELGRAITLAQENHASLTVLDIVESLPPSARMMITAATPDELKKTTINGRLERVQTILGIVGQEGVDPEVKVLFGNRAREIMSEVDENRYDLVLKSSEKAGLFRNIDKHLMRKCSIPLWLMESGGEMISDLQVPAFPGPAERDNSSSGKVKIIPGSESSVG